MDRLTVTSADPGALADFAVAAAGPGDHGSRIPLSFAAIVPGPAHLTDPTVPAPWPTGIRSLPPEPDPAWGPNQISMSFSRFVWPDDDEGWRLARWGTKWNLDDEIEVEGSFEAGRLVYGFSTAWSPPRQFVLAASRAFPAVRFDLCFGESGNDFAGRIVLEDGIFLIDEAWSGREAARELKALEWEVYEHFLPDEDDEAAP